MKFLIALAALIYILGSSATHQVIAQTLAPVEAGGFSLWTFAIIAAIALAGYGLYLWHKRNPAGADAALQQARDEASALAHKAVDAVQTLVKTNREQAMVIASPPVQATINAGAPLPAAPTPAPQTPAPIPQIEPGSTISPVPVSLPIAPGTVISVPPAQPKGAAMSAPSTEGITINPADYPPMDPVTGRCLDETLVTKDPQAYHLAINIWARQYSVQLMTDYQLRQAALYDSQRNRVQAANLIKMGYPADNPAIMRMLRSPEEVYVRLLKKQKAGGSGL